MLENPHLGPGVLSPNEVDADRLFAKIEQRTAELILKGPSIDDPRWSGLGWFAELRGDE